MEEFIKTAGIIVALLALAFMVAETYQSVRRIKGEVEDIKRSLSSLHDKVGTLLMRSGGLGDK